MKICFIYSQNNSGQCGITDYVGLIAQELEKLGHQIDRFFINNASGGMTDLPNSDLYSIQFAPYAYANNGIPKHTLKSLARKLQNQKIHLNFHEIWVGAYPRASWKEKGIGWLQKNLILRFINKCKPTYITSSNAAAIDRLRHTGIPVKFLYLFGNIPYSCESGATPKCDSLKVAFFGTPYADFNYGELEDFFSTLSKISGKIPEIIVIGRQRDKTGAKKLFSLCEKEGYLCKRTGDLPTDLISKQLQQCTLGVSTTPYDVIGKSGATAAMLEHGLPVLAYDDGDTPAESLIIPYPFRDQIFLINEHSSAEKLLQFIEKPRKSFFDGVANTAHKMIELTS